MIGILRNRLLCIRKRLINRNPISVPPTPFGILTINIRNYDICNNLSISHSVEIYRSTGTLIDSVLFDVDETTIKSLVIEFAENEQLYINSTSPYYLGFLCEANDTFAVIPESSVFFENQSTALSHIAPFMVKILLGSIPEVQADIALDTTINV